MPDQLTLPPPPGSTASGPRARATGWRVPALQALVAVALFALAGAVGGWGLHRLWSPPEGMVYDGRWIRGLTSLDPPHIDATADQQVFAAVGWFVVLGLAIGLVLGAATAVWLARSELVALAAVAVGGATCGLVMHSVATSLATPDPAELAADAADGTRIVDTLHLGTPWLALVVPAAGLLVLALVFLLSGPGRSRGESPGLGSARAG